MLMEPDPANVKDVTYVKLYLMVVNIIKCVRAPLLVELMMRLDLI